MLRQVPLALAFGLASAVLYATALSGSPMGVILAYLAMAPLFLLGLSQGVAALSLGASAAFIGIGVFGGFFASLVYAISHGLPVFLLTAIALRSRSWTDGQVYWYPSGRLAMALAIWVGSLMLSAALTLGVAGEGFRASVVQLLQAMGEMFGGGGQDGAALGDALSGMATFLPGIVAWSWMLMATLNGIVAQRVLRRMGRNLRPTPSLADLEIGPRWCLAFGVLALVSVLVPGDVGYTALNLALVMAYPMFLQGISVAHALFAHWGIGGIGYGLFYGLMILLGWTALAVVALGLAEPMLRIRARLAGGAQNT